MQFARCFVILSVFLGLSCSTNAHRRVLANGPEQIPGFAADKQGPASKEVSAQQDDSLSKENDSSENAARIIKSFKDDLPSAPYIHGKPAASGESVEDASKEQQVQGPRVKRCKECEALIKKFGLKHKKMRQEKNMNMNMKQEKMMRG